MTFINDVYNFFSTHHFELRKELTYICIMLRIATYQFNHKPGSDSRFTPRIFS
jgi:hypothetical protein